MPFLPHVRLTGTTVHVLYVENQAVVDLSSRNYYVHFWAW